MSLLADLCTFTRSASPTLNRTTSHVQCPCMSLQMAHYPGEPGFLALSSLPGPESGGKALGTPHAEHEGAYCAVLRTSRHLMVHVHILS